MCSAHAFPQRVDFIQAALDTTTDGHCIDLTILMTDEDGQLPEYVHSGRKSEGKSGIEVKSPEHENDVKKDQDEEEKKEGENGTGVESPENEKGRDKGHEKGAKKSLKKTLYYKIAQSHFEVCCFFFWQVLFLNLCIFTDRI